ncbi:MAG: diguanylate cyclase [Lachnospiraceae bacterium]|nr:diguanylate cyclase [Lachnospiraceae bacterium]
MKWIVIVDDDAVNLQVAGHLLSKAGMRVTAFKSGQAFIDQIASGNLPDLVLLDIRMPGMDGFETLNLLREYERSAGLEETPVIFLTADEDSGYENRGFALGASDYVHKPFDPTILIRRIRNVLNKQERISELMTEATIDKLTGFLNKAAVTEHFPSLIGEPGCLMMVDLDSFKLVNDLYGHDMGDRLLIAFANIMREEMPEGGECGRVGGDEFTLLLPWVTEEHVAADFIDIINRHLLEAARKLMGEDMDIPLGASAGAVFVPAKDTDYDELIRRADKALYVTKRDGTHGLRIYSEMMANEHAESDLQKLSAILGERNIPDKAYELDRNAFAYVYQFVIRYITRNHQNACKLLFTITADEADEKKYHEACDLFDEHLKQCLRKSDVYTRNSANQFFVFLTDIRQEYIHTVIEKIVDRWYEQYGHLVKLNYETEYVSMES